MVTKKWIALSLILVASICAADASAAAPACDARCLRTQLDHYLDALLRHDPTEVRRSSALRFTENGTVGALGDGLWQKASGLGTYRQYFVDPVSQQAMFLGIVNEGDEPAIASIRLGFKGGDLVEVEQIVARKGSHALFSPVAFVTPNLLLSSPVAPGKRLSRAKLIEVANSYFEGIQHHSSKLVKAAPDCQRIENGVQTTGRPGGGSRNCQDSADLLTYIKSVDNRRFPVVDVEHGIVVSTFMFDIPGEVAPANGPAISPDPQLAARLRQPRTLLLTEWFKIDDGVIQHIEAIMHNLPHGAKSGWE
jgi:hypothetical protein